jgi:hypothetical protein
MEKLRCILHNPSFIDVKAIPLQALTGPEGSRRLRFPDFNPLAPEFSFKF